MAGLDAAWEIFSKIIWPIIMIYIAYLHRELTVIMAKLDTLQTRHFDHRAEVNKNFVTHETMVGLENKITAVLNRIDDKVTRILEKERN